MKYYKKDEMYFCDTGSQKITVGNGIGLMIDISISLPNYFNESYKPISQYEFLKEFKKAQETIDKFTRELALNSVY